MRRSNLYKTSKGLIRVNAEIENNVIIRIRLTGDFFMVPESSLWLLEKHLKGVELDRKILKKVIDVFYLMGIDTPVLSRDDFINAIYGVKGEDTPN